MKKCIIILILVATGLISCRQGSKSMQITVDTETLNSTKKVQSKQLYEKYIDAKSMQITVDTETLSSTKKVQSQKVYEEYIDTKYEYTDSKGGSIIIQNSFPKGEGYTDPNGKQYFKTIFWTRIINETDNPLEFKIDFPVDSYEFLPPALGRYFKILLPSDTMTLDKVNLFNYGLTDLKSFLDNSIHKSFSLKRTINPKESSGFYVVILFNNGVAGPIRTGLSIKGQNLFYRVSGHESKPAGSLLEEKEINCGSINFKNMILKK